MSTRPERRANLRFAVQVVTAVRSGEFPDDDLRGLIDEIAVDAGGWGPLVLAMADLTTSILAGYERVATDLIPVGRSVADVGLDASAVLQRIGRAATGLDPDT